MASLVSWPILSGALQSMRTTFASAASARILVIASLAQFQEESPDQTLSAHHFSLVVVCLSLAFRVVSNSFQTLLAVATGGVATSPLYTIPHLVRQMKYDVMWLRVLRMVFMEVSLLVTVQSTDLQNDGRITGVESPFLPHHLVNTMLRTSLAHLQPWTMCQMVLSATPQHMHVVPPRVPMHSGGNWEGMAGQKPVESPDS